MRQSDGLLKADGLDDAIVGVSTKEIVVYSTKKIIKILMERDGMSYEDAIEFFYFNIEGAYMGENTPVFIADEF